MEHNANLGQQGAQMSTLSYRALPLFFQNKGGQSIIRFGYFKIVVLAGLIDYMRFNCLAHTTWYGFPPLAFLANDSPNKINERHLWHITHLSFLGLSEAIL